MEENEKRKNLGISAFVLLLSGVVCKVLGAFFRFPLTNLLGFEGIGIFQMIMSIYSFALVATCGGVTITLAKLISSARARGEENKIGTYFARAMLIGVGSGLVIGLAFFFGWRGISAFQGITENKSYMLFLVLLPTGSIVATIRGYFQGYENMMPTAISQVIEQVIKFAFGLFFAYIFGKLGVSNGVFGAFLGIVASEIVALLVVFVWFLLKRKKTKYRTDNVAKKEFDKANFLVLCSAAILPFASAIDGLVIVPRLVSSGLSNEMAVKLFGLQSGAIGAILNLPLVISVAVATLLLPSISFAISKGKSAKWLIEKALKLLLIFVLPTTFGLVAISKQMLPLFYIDMDDNLLQIAFNLMVYGGFSIVFTALMQFFVMLLQATGNFKYNLLITGIGGTAKVVLTIVLAAVPDINIFAVVFGNLILTTLICILSLIRLKKTLDFKLPFMDIFILLFSTLCMTVAVYSFMQAEYFSIIPNILVGILLGIVVYVVFTTPVLLKIFQKRRAKMV